MKCKTQTQINQQNYLLAAAGEGGGGDGVAGGVLGRIVAGWEVVDLLVAVHEVHEAVVVVVVVGALGRVGREQQVVWAEAVALRVGVGEDPRLQQLVVGVVDPRHDDPGAERQLLVLREEVVDVAVEHHPPHGLQRDDVLGPRLGDVERVEVEAVLVVGVDGLDEQLPLREVAGGDGVVEVLRGVAVVGPADGDGLVVEQRLDAAGRLPVELDVVRLAGAVDERVGVDAGAVHVAVVGGDADVVEEEGEHVEALRVVGEEVEDAPVLLDVRLGVGLERVHHVRELHAVADEEDGEVVADEVPVALPGVELDGEATRVAEGLRAAALVDDGGEADDDRGLDARGAEEVGAGEVGDVVGDLEEALGAGAAGVHHALRDTLPVEVGQLLNHVVVLQEPRA